MFFINRLRLEIIASEDPGSIYGFDIPFKAGLNVIAGQNSKGKSTIGACIYYALGMEELLGAKNEQALGKALRTTFDIFPSGAEEPISYHVSYSTIFIEIVNESGEIATIRRYINSGNLDSRSADPLAKKAMVFNTGFDGIASAGSSIPLFIRHSNNNADEFGFYAWLAQFIGIALPEVVNSAKKSTGTSPLYLQTIFSACFIEQTKGWSDFLASIPYSACFIEQTKGWSDFLASIPYFGIPKNKEKVIEFILNLSELSVSSKKDELDRIQSDLEKKWDKIASQMRMLASEHNGEIPLLPEELTGDVQLVDLVSMNLTGPNPESPLKNLAAYQSELYDELSELMKVPLKRVGENKESVRERLDELYHIQGDFSNQFKEFDTAYNAQKVQRDKLREHLQTISRELAAHKGIQNIIDDAIVVEDVYNQCPTCKQHVSDDLMRAEGVVIEKLSLEQNIAYLDGQQKLIVSSIKSLDLVIEEKAAIRRYYTRKQRELEEEIKTVLRELITDDRDYSDLDSLNRVRAENRYGELVSLRERFDSLRASLRNVSEQFNQNKALFEVVESETSRDRLTLSTFENEFREKLLSAFKYSSNKVWNVHIQRTAPFKYFPVFKFSEDDELPQSIKTNSSASDFVRTIWAYSLALSAVGTNHPGVVMFDEPGQHSVSSASLKVLFEKSAALSEKQTIIFTSIQKVLIKDGDRNVDALDLDSLLAGLSPDTQYTVYRIDDANKSIKRL